MLAAALIGLFRQEASYLLKAVGENNLAVVWCELGGTSGKSVPGGFPHIHTGTKELGPVSTPSLLFSVPCCPTAA